MRTLLAIAMVAASASAFAQPTVEVEVITRPIRVNSDFHIRISINGGFNDISLPESDEITVMRQPVGRSTRVNSLQGNVTTISTFELKAIPLKEGDLTLGSFTVHYDGGSVKTDPIQITAIASDAPAIDPQPAVEEDADQIRADEWEEFVWLESEVDKDEVYVGEAVTLTSTRWEIQAGQISITPMGPTAFSPQSTNGFYAVELPERREMAEYRNFPYRKDIFQQLLYPTTSGPLTIGEWEWRGQGAYIRRFGIGGARRGHPYQLRTDPIRVNVKPLPPSPQEFSGAVGAFEMSAAIEPASVVVGQPARLTVTITGEGNPEIIGAPKIAEMESAFITGPESHMLDLTPSDKRTVEKAFVWQIIPKKANNIEFAPVEFVYFNPTLGEYDELKSDPLRLGVVAAPEGLERVLADGGSIRDNQSTSVEVYAEALAPAIRNPGPIHTARSWTTPFAAALATPAAAYAVFLAWLLHYRRANSDSPEARKRNAYARGRKRLADLEGADTDIDALHQALRGYIADRLAVPEGGLTSHDAERLLTNAGIDASLTDSTVRTLRACERAAYASQSIGADEHKALLNSAVTNMDRLEAAFKGAGQL